MASWRDQNLLPRAPRPDRRRRMPDAEVSSQPPARRIRSSATTRWPGDCLRSANMTAELWEADHGDAESRADCRDGVIAHPSLARAGDLRDCADYYSWTIRMFRHRSCAPDHQSDPPGRVGADHQ